MQPNPTIESIPYLSKEAVKCDVLRLDQLHPVISGNKWYKLRYYVKEAIANNADTMASFGGPYSNHLVALAYMAQLNGLKSRGYVRSNDGEPITASLQEATRYGMELVFLGRSLFQEKKAHLLLTNNKENLTIKNKQPFNLALAPNTYLVDEGGYGYLGAKGASTMITDWATLPNKEEEGHQQILNAKNPLHNYDYIICAVGTGTMIAGLINAAATHQQIIGIPVLKNEGTIQNEITHLLANKNAKFELLHSFHQGGYAKTSPQQLAFMNQLWEASKLPTDIVYTSKVFYAVEQLIQKKYFKPNSKLLIIHSGGLQGNRSLAKGILAF